MRVCFGGLIAEPQPETIRGLRSERLAAEKFGIFCKNGLKFRLILTKTIALKRGKAKKLTVQKVD